MKYTHQYYLDNMKRIKRNNKKWSLKNYNYIKKKSNEWGKLHLDKKRESANKYYLNNKIKCKKRMRLWKLNNKSWIKNYKKEYNQLNYNININYTLSLKLRNHIYKALNIYTKTGKVLSSKKYGIILEEVIIKLVKELPKDYNGWNKNNPDNIYSIDHIKPLSSFNLENFKEVQIAFAPENHQWMKFLDNCSKGDKLNWKN